MLFVYMIIFPTYNFVTCVMWMHRRVVLWDWELMYFQAYVYIIFVYHVVYVDMSTRSSQFKNKKILNLSLSLLEQKSHLFSF